MLKKIISISAVLLMVIVMCTACGSSSQGSAEADQSSTEASDQADQDADDDAEQNTEAKAEDNKDAKAVDPYAWMGLQDIPKCDYLDVISTYHYYQTYDAYAMSIAAEETEAVDGINSFRGNDTSKSYSVDGKIISINESNKTYMESDMGDTMKDAEKNLKAAQKNGENIFLRHYVGTGKGAIPEYKDSGDTAEYEYYEYDYPETEKTGGSSILERYYMKDGDVFAIYTKTTTDDNELEYVQVIKSISQDIPDGTFEIPDLSGYEKYE